MASPFFCENCLKIAAIYEGAEEELSRVHYYYAVRFNERLQLLHESQNSKLEMMVAEAKKPLQKQLAQLSFQNFDLREQLKKLSCRPTEEQYLDLRDKLRGLQAAGCQQGKRLMHYELQVRIQSSAISELQAAVQDKQSLIAQLQRLSQRNESLESDCQSLMGIAEEHKACEQRLESREAQFNSVRMLEEELEATRKELLDARAVVAFRSEIMVAQEDRVRQLELELEVARGLSSAPRLPLPEWECNPRNRCDSRGSEAGDSGNELLSMVNDLEKRLSSYCDGITLGRSKSPKRKESKQIQTVPIEVQRPVVPQMLMPVPVPVPGPASPPAMQVLRVPVQTVQPQYVLPRVIPQPNRVVSQPQPIIYQPQQMVRLRPIRHQPPGQPPSQPQCRARQLDPPLLRPRLQEVPGVRAFSEGQFSARKASLVHFDQG